ncbi:carbohydrate-binding protein CenC [Duganella sp. FT92W]|uniref:Carbohydrate-binding protein CenC n=1 Tax=Pseudoduganella rivuli TaxID=2666085 RepID=A0A7X2ILX5_9BURK|nr:CehA/McbA family metallohydrolase [Pseudoduganella rivuli]MRV72280.1 carbohydrate-binding protein CenC [Pseudoduganella rivuli]
MRHLPRLTLLALASAATAAAFASEADHREFEATLHAPYRTQAATNAADRDARSFTLAFSYPHVQQAQAVHWQLELVAPNGDVLQRWNGVEALHKDSVQVKVDWDGRSGRASLADGIYQVRLRAVSLDAADSPAGAADVAVPQALARTDVEVHDQEWEMAIGQALAPAMPAFKAMPAGSNSSAAAAKAAKEAGDGAHQRMRQGAVAATASLPYTVYYGNMHSQTNHSDGGGALGSCTGAQAPQSAAFGPTDAYAYAKGRGLDFLMTSEHNHMYDGSDSTNTSANPATAKALYQSGLSAAASYNASNPTFLGIYGMEWGVINNGGHLNILNADELVGWEVNSSGQLLADTLVAKNDYASLYTLMRQRGWLGQFNHPETSGQFITNGTALGYTADGDQAMALCEVLNTSAFSTNTTETETGRSNYESACKKALEAGFHVAFSTNQDNHCANWGASYTNRTGVLIPTGTALTQTSFMDAVRARRVFATMDKTSQLVLTANGSIMGERITNNGALTLTANFASTSGKTASTVQIFEGVPGRNGTVTQLASVASTTITPSNGEHFYYAKVTQNDGNILWSAPIWVTQGAASSDTVAPTVSASSSGTSGTITLSASASDNVGVTNVEFYVDGALKGSDNTAPYSLALNSTTLANGSHTLTAKAYDAAGNSTTSTGVPFTVNNTTAQQLIVNGGFESGASSWTATSGVISNDSSAAARTGSYKAWLNGYGSTHTDTLYQQVAIPSAAASANLSFWLKVASDETTTTQAYDTLKVQVRNTSGTVLATLATYSNLNKGTSYVQRTFSLDAYKGQTVRIYFEGIEGSAVQTSFLIDDVTVNVQ